MGPIPGISRKLQVKYGAWQLLNRQNDQPIRLLHVGSELGQQLVRRNTDGACQAFSDLALYFALDVLRQSLRHRRFLLYPVEAAGDFINGHDIFYRHVLVDGGQNPVVIFDVKLVVGLHQLHIRAKPPRFMHQCASFYAQCLRRVARRNRAGGLRHRRYDDDRLALQLRIFLLFARSEKTVQIKNEPTQQGGTPWWL